MPTNDGRLSRIQGRLLDHAEAIEREDPQSILYQHSVLAQVGLPYRDPGRATRLWQRSQGAAHLEIEAGRAFDPDRGAFIDIALPFGCKARLILCHLNASALRSGSPEVEVEDSLSAFVQRIGLCRDGRSIRVVKDQLTRLAAAEIRLALAFPGTRGRQIQTHIVSGFELWLPKDERQRVLWPSTVNPFRRLLREPAAPRRAPGRARDRRAVSYGPGTGYLLLAGATPAPGVAGQARVHSMAHAAGPIRPALP